MVSAWNVVLTVLYQTKKELERSINTLMRYEANISTCFTMAWFKPLMA